MTSLCYTKDGMFAAIDYSYLHDRTSHKNIYLGRYVGRYRHGDVAVEKAFTGGAGFVSRCFASEIGVMQHAQKIIRSWNSTGIGEGYTVVLNQPVIAQEVVDDSLCWIEPFIDDFEKFNSNTGWTSNTGDAREAMLQALSHWSYHSTGGQFLLCDLQGGLDDDLCILTDPAIMSQQHNYGPTDLGKEGVRFFFQGHQCTDYCDTDWMRPSRKVDVQGFSMKAGTTIR